MRGVVLPRLSTAHLPFATPHRSPRGLSEKKVVPEKAQPFLIMRGGKLFSDSHKAVLLLADTEFFAVAQNQSTQT